MVPHPPTAALLAPVALMVVPAAVAAAAAALASASAITAAHSAIDRGGLRVSQTHSPRPMNMISRLSLLLQELPVFSAVRNVLLHTTLEARAEAGCGGGCAGSGGPKGVWSQRSLLVSATPASEQISSVLET